MKALKIGVVGCGLQAATITGYLGVFGDAYEVAAVMDIDPENAKAKLALKQANVAKNCFFCSSMEEFIGHASDLNGIIIGTYCASHTPVACQLEALGIPIYMEKPVAVDGAQLKKLRETFLHSSTPIQVSLPMRVCPLTERADEIIRSGRLGKIGQIIGFEETSGDIYFTTWFRDYEKTGGMFMQKAVHDIDYLLFLAGTGVRKVCAIKNKICFAGDKPYDITCKECPDVRSCPRGPLARFDRWGSVNSFAEGLEQSSVVPANGGVPKKRYCPYSKEIAIEDVTACIAELNNGVQLIHTQNFIISGPGGRRGARFVGDAGILEIDFNHGRLHFLSMPQGGEESFTVPQGALSHYGGDRRLVADFLRTMKTGERSGCDLIHGNGLLGTAVCLAARESAVQSRFIEPETEFY